MTFLFSFICLGAGRPGTSISEVPVEIDDQCYEEFPGNNECQSPDDPEDKFSKREIQQFPLLSVLRSAFCHMKAKSLVSSMDLHARDQQNCVDDTYSGVVASVRSNKILPSTLTSNSALDIVKDGLGETGSYTCNFSVNPFWPLCMYELRGKCNDEECTLQHIKDYTKSNMNQNDDSYLSRKMNQNDDSDIAGMHIPYQILKSKFHACIILYIFLCRLASWIVITSRKI